MDLGWIPIGVQWLTKNKRFNLFLKQISIYKVFQFFCGDRIETSGNNLKWISDGKASSFGTVVDRKDSSQ